MAKANIETASGTKIEVEGTSEEIARIVAVINPVEKKLLKHTRALISPTRKNKKIKTATEIIIELEEEGCFNKPQGLMGVKKILEEKGHIYPITTLSPVLLRLVKNKLLRRMKEGKKWAYVKGNI
ncbi:MAG: hypothetical protein AABX70_02630 [Nanoarchaeota archaeon]|mgnify:CR=1 FL=1